MALSFPPQNSKDPKLQRIRYHTQNQQKRKGGPARSLGGLGGSKKPPTGKFFVVSERCRGTSLVRMSEYREKRLFY
jgi:hypothetical protein